MQVACNRTVEAHPFGFVASSMEAQAHTSCNRRAGYHVQETAPPLAPMRAFSTAEPVPRLEATLHMAQQCQSSISITGQSAAGGGVTVDMAKSGPTVMAAADGQKQWSNRLQARVPS
jgi:dienelactone hydrolase